MINRKITFMSSLTSSESKDCAICCEPFTATRRSVVKCPYCPLAACKICSRRYLLENALDAHCMGCKKAWDRKFCQEALNESFYNGAYKNHRKNLLFETEKARIPETMPAVENYKKIGDLEKQKSEAKRATQKLKEQLYESQRIERQLLLEIRRARSGTSVKKEEEIKKFIKKCPADGCEGYLSSQWKCGACNIWVCPQCEVEKGFDKDAEHTCNPDNVASAKLIKKETRQCPSCNVPIFKISGCDQMWCTSCKVAFSWKTGRRIQGTIHNPHFYAYQRNNGGNIQNPGAVICGGLPTYYNMRDRLRSASGRITLQSGLQKKILTGLLRGATHFQYTVLNPIRQNLQQNDDNQDLRIKFVVKEITEKRMKSSLMTRDKKKEKQQQLIHICELMMAVYTETCINIHNMLLTFTNQRRPYDTSNHTAGSLLIQNIDKDFDKIDRVRIYCNIEFMKVSVLYGHCVEIVTDNYDTQSINAHESKKWLNSKNAGNFKISRDEKGNAIKYRYNKYEFQLG